MAMTSGVRSRIGRVDELSLAIVRGDALALGNITPSEIPNVTFVEFFVEFV
jgi:hypothetical protein